MSQILDYCAQVQNILTDCSTKVDQISTKITTLEASVGATQEEVDAVNGLRGAVTNLDTKLGTLLP